jgi:hypothetical protein
LILNPPEQLQRVCEFIGVRFSPAMLKYSEHSTPPDPSAVQRWRKKLSPRDAALVEIRTGTLLLRRNYKPSGYPLDPPGFGERMSLFWTNKASKWQFGLRRYGVINFGMEKITRRLCKPIHRVFVDRINEIKKQHLK